MNRHYKTDYMKKNIILILVLVNTSIFSQNISINTTGAAAAATNMLEVLSTSTTASSVGIYSAHSGAITGTGYAIWAQKTGASTTNVAGYFSASGATSNYAIIVPASGGSVGIGTSTPESLLEVQGTEGNDATITLDADDGDNPTDTWFIASTATGNYLNFTNDVNEYFRMTGPKLYVMNSGQSVFIGENAGAVDDLSTNRNVFVGYNAGAANTTGQNNVYVGHSSGTGNIIGSFNVAVGYNSLADSYDPTTSPSYNTAIGSYSLKSCESCDSNTAIGYNALGVVVSTSKNTGIGNNCMELVTGKENTAVGSGALKNVSSGERNIALGTDAGDNMNTGSHNLIIGYDIEIQQAAVNNQLNIGNIIYGINIDGSGATVSTGSIGIGAPSPEAKLEVQGFEANDASFALDADDGDNNTDTWFIKSQAADNDLTFTNHVTELMRIMDNGNVGINTNNPGEKLQVVGNIKATTFIATTAGAGAYKYNTASNMTVPDYVFESYYDSNTINNPEYKMMKLSDLEKYLQKNKHLPRVPSRGDILEDKGVNLQGLGMISLEKIEESTLYIIELQKKLEEQKKEIMDQEIRLQKLEEIIKSK